MPLSALDIALDAAREAAPDFAFHLPLSISKGGLDRAAEGLASTGDVDRDGETLIQKGLDWSMYDEDGKWNDSHAGLLGKGNVIVGVPTAPAEYRKGQGWFVRGVFLENDRGDYYWDTAKALKKAGDIRKLAFSIEGKAIERDEKNPKIIRKAMIWGVAVTDNPRNPRCTLDALVKAGNFGAMALDLSKALAATAGAGTSVAAMTREDLEGSSGSKQAAAKKLIEYLARYYQNTRGVSWQVALRTAIDYIKRQIAARKE